MFERVEAHHQLVPFPPPPMPLLQLLNLPSVTAACKLLNEQLGLSAYNIVVSTVGTHFGFAQMEAQILGCLTARPRPWPP